MPKINANNNFLEVTRDDLQKETINMVSPKRLASGIDSENSYKGIERQSSRASARSNRSNYGSRAQNYTSAAKSKMGGAPNSFLSGAAARRINLLAKAGAGGDDASNFDRQQSHQMQYSKTTAPNNIANELNPSIQ